MGERRFDWISFLLGAGAGVFLAVAVGIIGMFGLVFVGQKVAGRRGPIFLPPVAVPPIERLAGYGQSDPDWRLRTLDGQETTLGALRGRPVFLNVWATWCPPCVGELPAIGELVASMAPDDVAFVLVSEEDAATVRRFATHRELDLPIYLTDEIPALFRLRGIPATFVIDAEGAVVFRHFGAAQWDHDDVRRFLAALGRRAT